MGQFKLFIITIMYHSLVHTWPLRTAKDQRSISDPFFFFWKILRGVFLLFRFVFFSSSFFSRVEVKKKFKEKIKPRHRNRTRKSPRSSPRTHANALSRARQLSNFFLKKQTKKTKKLIITPTKGAITLTLKYRLLFFAPRKKTAHPV